MIARIGAAKSRPSIAARQRFSAAFFASLLLWLVLIAGRGALTALHAFGLPVGGELRQRFASNQLLVAAGLVVLFCVSAALLGRRFRPAATLPVTFASGGLVLLAAAFSSGSLGPLLLVLAAFAVVWVVGYGVLCRLPSSPQEPIVSLPVAFALGLAIIGLLLFLLAALGWLNAVAVAALAVAVLVSVLMFDWRRFAAGAAQLRAWRPETPSWFETIVIGVAVGALCFAMLSDFVPEYDSDASRDHLPVAREIWQSGTVGEFPPLPAAQRPVQVHLLYAVAYGLAGEGYAGITAAKLFHAGVGLTAIAGIAGLGWLCSGRLAAVVGAAVFATIPLVLWDVGHATLDLFPVLFTVAAVLCLLHWQRVGAPVWLVVAGAFAGFGFVAKVTMAWVAVALAVAIFLVGRKPWQLRERVLAALVFGLGTVVVAPWLVRGYAITGTLPGLDMMVDLFTSWLSSIGVQGVSESGTPAGVIAPTDPAPVAPEATPPAVAGPGHSPVELARMPWLLTFEADRLRFATLAISPIGIAPLLLLPLALLGPRTRAAAVLAVTAVVSYVLWWVTPLQVVRHLLPTLAIVAVLVSTGVASAVAGAASGLRRSLAVAVQAGVLIGVIAGPLLFLSEKETAISISIDRITGRETPAMYVDRVIPSAHMLAATTELLPPDTRVGYVGAGEYAQMYSEARLIRLPLEIVSPLAPEATPAEVQAIRDRLGVDYVMWDRTRTSGKDWQTTLLSTAFLREHTRIIAGERDGYLFEVLVDEGKSWGEEQLRNLLDDPGLETVKRGGDSWTTVGQVRARDGRVSMRDESSISQRVPVTAGSPYLLSAAAACSHHADRAELRLHWFDGAGVAIGSAGESVVPGTEGSEQFLWRRAPDQAASVSAELAAKDCVFDEAALYQLS